MKCDRTYQSSSNDRKNFLVILDRLHNPLGLLQRSLLGSSKFDGAFILGEIFYVRGIGAFLIDHRRHLFFRLLSLSLYYVDESEVKGRQDQSR